MFKLNNKEYEITLSKINFSNTEYNNKTGYSIYINLEFLINNNKGYINIGLDYFDNCNYNFLINKTYKDNPCNIPTSINYIEIFDTKMFYDFIDSDVSIRFGNIINNKIEMNLLVDDENIKIEYSDLVELQI